jgi:hypothetical protein
MEAYRVEMLRIPQCLDSRLTYGGKTVSHTHRPRFTVQKHFFLLLVLISVRGRVNSRAQCSRQSTVTFGVDFQPYAPATLHRREDSWY